MRTARWILFIFPLLTGGLLAYELPRATGWLTTGMLVVMVVAGYGLFGWLLVLANRSNRRKTILIERMVKSFPGGMYIIDAEGKYTSIHINSPKLRPLFPDPATLIGRSYREHMRSIGVDPEQSDLIHSLERGAERFHVKTRLGPYHLAYDTVPVFDSESKKIVGAACYWHDITEEEQARLKIKELNEKNQTLSAELQQLLDTLPLSVLKVDKNGIITGFNDTCVTYYEPEVKREELLGMDCRELARRRGAAFENMHLSKALRGNTINGAYSSYGQHAFLSFAYPLYESDSEEITGAVGIYQDVTEFERLRMRLTQMESLSLVGQMAASITHEIRNPMAVIKGFVQLQQEKNNEMFGRYYQIIIEELDRANEIINDFLTLAQNRVVEMVPAQLNGTLSFLEPMLLADAHIRGVELWIETEEPLPPVKMNEKEIRQMLLNLTRNAFDAMEEMGGVLRIRTYLEQGEVAVSIADSGPGIPQDKLMEIFKPFFTTKEKGTGIGLSVCMSIAEKHGGRLEIDSTVGKGTTVTVRLPAAIVTSEIGEAPE